MLVRQATFTRTFVKFAILLGCLSVVIVPGHETVVNAAVQASSPDIYFGLEYPGVPDPGALSKYEGEIGKPVSLVLWYESWVSYGQPQFFPVAQMNDIRQHGSIPVLAWYPDEYPSPSSLAKYSLANIINGTWDNYIRQYAQQAAAWGHPFFLRFASEMNGSWTPWSEQSNGNSPGQFVRMWRHVHDIFTSVGATNVTWAWCPNTEGYGTTPIQELYPGNTYVDWAGVDGYNFGPRLGAWRPFYPLFHPTYQHELSFIPSTMPIMIGETGSVEDGGSKAGWITDALTTELPKNFPRIEGFIWFDAKDGNYDLSLDTSQQALSAFRGGIAADAYAPNLYSNLVQYPIPVPQQVVIPSPPSPALISYVKDGQQIGHIQVADAQHNAPIPRVTLVYQSGARGVTDSAGRSMLPAHEPGPVLEAIVVGSTEIVTQLPVNGQQGYQVQIDQQGGKIAHVTIHEQSAPIISVPIPKKSGSLLVLIGVGAVLVVAMLILIVTARIRSRSRKRIGVRCSR